jgi:hypothetical protein
MTTCQVFFQATRRSKAVLARKVTSDDLAGFAGALSADTADDQLGRWTLVALEFPEAKVELHALGWRSSLDVAWITSPLHLVDIGRGLVWTHSCHL